MEIHGMGAGVQVLLASAFLALAAVAGAVWMYRGRAARRLQAAADAYAEREIARAPRGPAPKRVRVVSTLK